MGWNTFKPTKFAPFEPTKCATMPDSENVYSIFLQFTTQGDKNSRVERLGKKEGERGKNVSLFHIYLTQWRSLESSEEDKIYLTFKLSWLI